MDPSAAVAALRFGLGPRPDSPPPGDPGGWLLAQLVAPPDPATPPQGWEQEPTLADAMALRQLDQRSPLPGGQGNRGRTLFALEQRAYVGRLVETPTPFRERLVAF